MNSRVQSKVRLCLEHLENRLVPAVLTPIEPPGLDANLGPYAQVQSAESDASAAHDRAIHLEDAGNVVINPDLTVDASASGTATHLGKFTLTDHSTLIPNGDGTFQVVDGVADLVSGHGHHHLYARFTGTVDMNTGTATIYFEWNGGTGRFADATGSTVWQISLNPDFSYTAVADGVIRY